MQMIDGHVECGPNAVFSFKREGYKKIYFSLQDTFESLAFRGLWKFADKHLKLTLLEYRRVWSKRIFLKSLQRLTPSLTMKDIARSRAGLELK